MDDALRKGFHASHPDIIVWRAGDPTAPPVGASDPEILIWCEQNGFSLVTNSRDTIPDHLRDHLAAGRHVPGIFTLSPKMSIGETMEELVLGCSASEPEEFGDQVSYLPLSS